MTLDEKTFRAADHMRTELSARLKTHTDWNHPRFSIGMGNDPYKWFHINSYFYPSSLGLYDAIFGEMYEEYESAWMPSRLRECIKLANGTRDDVLPTVEVIEGWIRRPDVWNDVALVSGSVSLSRLSAEEHGHLTVMDEWSLLCKATATATSPMPAMSLSRFRDERHFDQIRNTSATTMNLFLAAAIATDYEPFVATPFLHPTLPADTVSGFCEKLDEKYGNAYLWVSALSRTITDTSEAPPEVGRLVEIVDDLHDNKVTADRYVAWSKMGMSIEQIKSFSANEIDMDMIGILREEEMNR